MADNTIHDQKLERVMSELASSILELSDDEIFAEVDAAALQEAEATRAVLRDATRLLDTVNRHLKGSGHTISPQRWQQHGDSAYKNHCLTCGLSVSFTSTTGEIWGSAMEVPCPRRDYAVRRRAVSVR